jgi:hypothetical protein
MHKDNFMQYVKTNITKIRWRKKSFWHLGVFCVWGRSLIENKKQNL